MGATGWHYFVPYQNDVNQALQDLRNEIFARKAYRPVLTEEEGLAVMERFAAMSPNPQKVRAQMQALLDMAKRWEAIDEEQRGRKKLTDEPQTIDELLEQRAESGTGTILDMDHVSEQREFGALYPLSPAQRLAFFGTERPTRAMVEHWQNRIQSLDEPQLYGRWEGFYVIAYAGDKPESLYFEGCSGD